MAPPPPATQESTWGISCAAQPSPTGALWPKMFPSPFLRLDSIPPILPPPSGNVAAINSLNTSADARASRAKTPFPGPGPSWASTVLGCARASGWGRSLWCGWKGCEVVGEGWAHQNLGALPAVPWILPAFGASSLNHRAQLSWPGPCLASPASGSSLFIPFFLLPLSPSLPCCNTS